MREEHAPPLAGHAPTDHEPAPEARPWRHVSTRLADATGRTLGEDDLAALAGALGRGLTAEDVRAAFASFEASAAIDRSRDRNRRKRQRKARR